MSIYRSYLAELLETPPPSPNFRVKGFSFVPAWYTTQINEYLDILWRIINVGKQTKGRNNYSNNLPEFVDIRIDAARKEEAKAYAADVVEHLPNILAQHMKEGYRFSTRWDEANECYLSTMTMLEEGHVNSGKSLSSRSSDWVEAIALCLYKTHELCPKGKWPNREELSAWG